MTVNNINSSTAQLQLYANDKTAAINTSASAAEQTKGAQTTATQQDSVQISEQARALQLKDAAAIGNVSPLTNGMGIEPPKSN